MVLKIKASSFHSHYYLSQLKNIEKLFKQSDTMALAVGQWELEKENINFGHRYAQEFAKSDLQPNELLDWYEYSEVGYSLLMDIDPFLVIEWTDASLNTARIKGDFEKQLDLTDFLALTYKLIGQPKIALRYLQDELHLARNQGLREKESYTLNELGDMYQIINSGNLPFGILRKFSLSIHYYRKALDVAREIGCNNEIAYALKELGQIYLLSGYCKHAEAYFNSAISYTQTKDRVIKRECLYGLAQVYSYLGKRTLAISYLRDAMSLIPMNAGNADISFATLNNPLILDIDPNEYLELMDKLLKTHNMIPAHKITLLLHQASIYNITGRDQESLAKLENAQALIKSTGNVQKEAYIRLLIIRTQLFGGNKYAAIQSYQEFIEWMKTYGYPPIPMIKAIQILLKWPVIILRSMNFFGHFLYKGRKIVYAMLRLRSSYLEWRLRAESMEEADLDMELNDLLKLLEKYPEKHNKRLKLAEIYLKLKDPGLAIKEIEGFLNNFPDNPQAYKTKGDILDDLGDYANALTCYSKAISLQPRNAEFWVNRGLLQFHNGALENALSDFSAAIHLRPQQGLYYAHRGMALSRLGKNSEAEKEFEKAVKLKANAYYYIDRASIAALNLDIESTKQNLKIAFENIPTGTLKAINYDPCFAQIKNLPEFRESMQEFLD